MEKNVSVLEEDYSTRKDFAPKMACAGRQTGSNKLSPL